MKTRLISWQLTLLLVTLLRVPAAWAQYEHGYPYSPGPLPAAHGCANTASTAYNTRPCKAIREFKAQTDAGIFFVAHRGLWTNTVPENSYLSLTNAVDHGFMIVELDINRSADGVLIVMHDKTITRELNLAGVVGIPVKADGQYDGTNQQFWCRNLNYSKGSNVACRQLPGQPKKCVYVPAMNSLAMKNRLGQPTTQKLGSLGNMLVYAKDKEVIISLDIKEDDKPRYISIVKDCLNLINQYGMLHRVIFKIMSNEGKPATAVPNTIILPGDIKAAFGVNSLEWELFSQRTNVIPLNFVPSLGTTGPKAIGTWFDLPSLIGMDHYYKNETDPFLTGGPSLVQQTKKKGFRVGNYWELPTDCRGNFIGNGSGWKVAYKDGIADADWDKRGNPEFMMHPPFKLLATDPNYGGDYAYLNNTAGYVVADSPISFKSFCDAQGIKISPLNFNSGGFKP